MMKRKERTHIFLLNPLVGEWDIYKVVPALKKAAGEGYHCVNLWDILYNTGKYNSERMYQLRDLVISKGFHKGDTWYVCW